MIKIENVEVMGWGPSIRGMRNPMNSWNKCDSGEWPGKVVDIGPNDHTLMMNLAHGGPVHAKYRRMITVYLKYKEEESQMKCKYHKPEMDVLLDLCKRLYKLPGCGAGGCLHILLDDDNYRDSDLEWCRQYCEDNAEGEERKLAMKILDMYSAMSLTERTVFDWYLNGNNLKCSDPTKCETCDLCKIPDYMEEADET